MTKNPFAVLGLHPDIVAKEKLVIIDELISANYRILQRYYHPDITGGSTKKSHELAEAREALDRTKNEKSFEQYREAFVKKSKSKTKDVLAGLEERIRSTQLALAKQSELTIDFMRCLYFGSKELCIYNFTNTELRLGNVVKSLMRDIGDVIMPQRMPDARFYLKADSQGALFVKEGREYKSFPDKVFLIGCVPENRKGELFQVVRGLAKAKNQDKLLSYNVSASFQYYDGVFTETEMAQLTPLLSPFITKKGYMFSMLAKKNGDMYFRLEGQVLEINPTT